MERKEMGHIKNLDDKTKLNSVFNGGYRFYNNKETMNAQKKKWKMHGEKAS